ncbi:photosystem II assembly protein, partial [Synechococcus lacustris str. Tous]
MTNFLRQKLNALIKPVLSAVLLILLTTGCVTTGLATAASSPWQTVPLSTSANPLD